MHIITIYVTQFACLRREHTSKQSSPNTPQRFQFIALEGLSEKDLQIAELLEEVKRLRNVVNSIRFGSKSERRRPEEDSRQTLLFSAVELPAA
jgi:hypothetical protein